MRLGPSLISVSVRARAPFPLPSPSLLSGGRVHDITTVAAAVGGRDRGRAKMVPAKSTLPL